MIAAIGYYLFVIPLSYLPLPVLYLFTDFFFLLLITIAPYRKKVIEGNIARSFPEKTLKERAKIKRQFYRHFTNLLAEGVKNLTLSKRMLLRRFRVVNPELMDELYARKKNVLLVSGHYNNWEWLITSQPLHFKHKAFGIGMPMTSAFWDKKINARRSRFGMNVIHAKNYKDALAAEQDLHAVLVLSDQSPGDATKSYWMHFLNQPTAVLFGTELMANELDYAVVFFIIRKVRRGFYELELTTITEEARNLNWGEITERHVKLLEQEIVKSPPQWLWSHKRWKRDVPIDLIQLKELQREKFNSKYRN